ncbi:MAG: DUF2249 domain-containing protein [Usitatibacter sp.]
MNCFKEIAAPRGDHLPIVKPVTDLRGLDPPEPLVRILDALEAPGDGPHRFLLSRNPVLLYPLLVAGRWRHALRQGDTGFELTLFREARKNGEVAGR